MSACVTPAAAPSYISFRFWVAGRSTATWVHRNLAVHRTAPHACVKPAGNAAPCPRPVMLLRARPISMIASLHDGVDRLSDSAWEVFTSYPVQTSSRISDPSFLLSLFSCPPSSVVRPPSSLSLSLSLLFLPLSLICSPPVRPPCPPLVLRMPPASRTQSRLLADGAPGERGCHSMCVPWSTLVCSTHRARSPLLTRELLGE